LVFFRLALCQGNWFLSSGKAVPLLLKMPWSRYVAKQADPSRLVVVSGSRIILKLKKS
jgi:hypothetical protein